ncbi:MAG: hypothetical protein GWP06_07265 [Actinobacteria bacterium]|nr:hypothetical protein [Actinomycetota bacterium]
MKKTLVALSLVFLIMSAMYCSKTKPKEEWINVMPGPNFEGWTIVDIPADGPLSETPQWSFDKIWHQAQMGSASGGYLFGYSFVNGEEKRVSTKDQMKDMKNPVKPAGE